MRDIHAPSHEAFSIKRFFITSVYIFVVVVSKYTHAHGDCIVSYNEKQTVTGI